MASKASFRSLSPSSSTKSISGDDSLIDEDLDVLPADEIPFECKTSGTFDVVAQGVESSAITAVSLFASTDPAAQIASKPHLRGAPQHPTTTSVIQEACEVLLWSYKL
ncbi:hypothetical protein E2C01_001872 [Portunus trituberculatus]|uniref:Uncharacterized protein n=1 Tax=Portunus trituberculatus TaxID=210409 RepID=A0A5B7CJD0_PORTR|nr:hypothetical protein [Portunus trituberculatus]